MVAGMTGMTGGTGATFVPGSPTWGAVFQEIITDKSCSAGPFCHGGALGQGGLAMEDKMTAYTALVGVAAQGVTNPSLMLPNCKDSGLMRVAAGQPDMSLVVKKVEGMPPCGQTMPPNGPPLGPDQVAQLRAWIMNGAMND